MLGGFAAKVQATRWTFRPKWPATLSSERTVLALGAAEQSNDSVSQQARFSTSTSIEKLRCRGVLFFSSALRTQ